MNLKEAIELIDPEIEKDLKDYIDYTKRIKDYKLLTPENVSKMLIRTNIRGILQGRLSQMKREVEFLIQETREYCGLECPFCKRIEALNILIKHFEEILK